MTLFSHLLKTSPNFRIIYTVPNYFSKILIYPILSTFLYFPLFSFNLRFLSPYFTIGELHDALSCNTSTWPPCVTGEGVKYVKISWRTLWSTLISNSAAYVDSSERETGYLSQMCLQFVLGVHIFSASFSDGCVGGVPLVHDGRRYPRQQLLYVASHVPWRRSLVLRSRDVVTCELNPCQRNGIPGQTTKTTNLQTDRHRQTRRHTHTNTDT